MKTLKKTSLFLLVSLLLCTCMPQEKEQTDPDTTGGLISIAGQTEAQGTKTTMSGVETIWAAGSDKIGIFSPEARTTDGGSTAVKNAEFTAQTSAKNSAFTGTMFFGGAGDHHFTAYYPRNPEYTGERTAVPVSLSSAQTQSAAGNTAHIGALDFMVATPIAVTPPGAVNFTFNHVFAMIEFQIVGRGQLTQINLIGADPLACEGTINLTQTPAAGTPYTITASSTSDFVSVTLGSTGVTLDEDDAVSIYMMVLPGAQSDDMAVALKIDGNWKILDKTPPTGGFARGQKYVVSLDTESTTAGWYSTITDSRDSNFYNLVVIGGQIWMAKNLAYLPSEVGVVDPETGSITVPYCYVYGYYGTDEAAAKATSNYTTYGVLYNWTAAMNGAESRATNPSGVQGVCPSGWHLPSDAEWKQLEMALGMSSDQANNTGNRGTDEGGKIKEAGTAHWKDPNTGATNSSGFTALPGDYRRNEETFSSIGYNGYWWSSTERDTYNAWYRELNYYYSTVYRSGNCKEYGFSVRCLRD
jgi:uncharacterized protein (TIGR02145 family)